MPDETAKLKLLIFTSPTCSVCDLLKKRGVVEVFKKDHPDGEVDVASVNVDTTAGGEFADAYNVRYMPTFIFTAFDEPSVELSRADGFQTLAQLTALYRKARNKIGM